MFFVELGSLLERTRKTGNQIIFFFIFGVFIKVHADHWSIFYPSALRHQQRLLSSRNRKKIRFRWATLVVSVYLSFKNFECHGAFGKSIIILFILLFFDRCFVCSHVGQDVSWKAIKTPEKSNYDSSLTLKMEKIVIDFQINRCLFFSEHT